MVGRTLASLALDRSDDPTRLAFVDSKVPRVPPEPFHWIGGESIRLGIAKKEEAEMAESPPGPRLFSYRQGPAAAGLPHRPVSGPLPRRVPSRRTSPQFVSEGYPLVPALSPST